MAEPFEQPEPAPDDDEVVEAVGDGAELDGGDATETAATTVGDELQVVAVEYARDHWADIGLGVAAAVVTMLCIEAIKPWVKLGAARRGVDKPTVSAILRTFPYLFGAPISMVLDFSTHWHNMTGSTLDTPSAVLLGGVLTGGACQLLYTLIHELRPIKAVRVRFHRLVGVTDEDLRNATATYQTITKSEAYRAIGALTPPGLRNGKPKRPDGSDEEVDD